MAVWAYAGHINMPRALDGTLSHVCEEFYFVEKHLIDYITQA